MKEKALLEDSYLGTQMLARSVKKEKERQTGTHTHEERRS
jgi:hypothetical protein